LLGSARLVARRAGSHPGVLLTATLTALVATDGHVVVDGQKLGDLDERGLLRLRRERIGFVFQSFGLLPFLSAARTPACRCACSAGQPPSARSGSRSC
jgi:predicted ABC-type transport system involved in lysophospholipase L1 biosynthesis ATPase subunit